MNIFLNAYQQPENKLTYNFLSLLNLINDKNIAVFLLDKNVGDKPITDIKTVHGGGETNPDGSFRVKLADGQNIKVVYENKTNRRVLSEQQLIGHLKQCDPCDILLVTSPRKSDLEIIRNINDKRIILKTWQEISLFIKSNYANNDIAMQFVEYGKKSGEFDELGEIYLTDLNIYYDYLKINFDKKIESIFRHFLFAFDFNSFGFTTFNNRYFTDGWGRRGIEIKERSNNTSYGQWASISLYYDTEDHNIPFKNGVPEIAFFFDILPDRKRQLQDDVEFNQLADRLVAIGFESNLNNESSANKWRLLFYRKPLTSFTSLNVQELIMFSENVLNSLLKEQALRHPYFKELIS